RSPFCAGRCSSGLCVITFTVFRIERFQNCEFIGSDLMEHHFANPEFQRTAKEVLIHLQMLLQIFDTA
ncbi:hypothetical protein OR221_0462, partial [Microbacterium laevaniformans OR221]